MANDTKKEAAANTVEQRLKSLYQLQTVLSEIDRIKTIRGELPLEVKDLEDSIAGLNTRIDNYTAEIAELKRNLSAEKAKIENCEALIARYQDQINNVRNNREFDLLTKEIDFQNLEIELADKHINEYSRQIENKNADIAATRESLADNEHILSEKKAELSEIVSETRQEEDTLRDKAKALEPQIDERTLAAFKRIRKNSRNGLGIVYVQRDACGGCFNKIPPQRQLDIRSRKKIIVCEYCGRIMIDPELAGVTGEPKADAAKEKPTRRRRTTASDAE